MYCLFSVVLCIVCVYMCTVLLPLGGYPIAVNKYIISYHIIINDKASVENQTNTWTGSRVSVVNRVTTLRPGQSRVRIPVNARVFLFSKSSRPTLGTDQPPVKWVPLFLLREKVSWGIMLTTSIWWRGCLHVLDRNFLFCLLPCGGNLATVTIPQPLRSSACNNAILCPHLLFSTPHTHTVNV